MKLKDAKIGMEVWMLWGGIDHRGRARCTHGVICDLKPDGRVSLRNPKWNNMHHGDIGGCYLSKPEIYPNLLADVFSVPKKRPQKYTDKDRAGFSRCSKILNDWMRQELN